VWLPPNPSPCQREVRAKENHGFGFGQLDGWPSKLSLMDQAVMEANWQFFGLNGFFGQKSAIIREK
jgi:hypothetical protein